MDKELSELNASLDTISKTSNELINDIDRNFREICKERRIDLTKEEQTVEAEPIPDTSVEEMSTAEVKDEPTEPIKEETEQSVEADSPSEENAPTPSEVEETSEDLPDPTLTVKEMNDSGYLKEDNAAYFKGACG